MVVGFTSWGWARSPAYLLLASEKITHDLSAFNETVVLGEAIRSSDVFTNRRRKITSEKKNAKKTLPIVGQKNQGSNEEDDFSECLRDPAKAIQKVRKIRHVKDIHTWMQEVVRNGAERPFGRWSVKAQIDFVKVLQDYQAYEPIMFFLRHVGKASVKVCTTAIFSMALSSDHRYLASEILDFMEEQKVRPTSLTFIALLGSIDGAKATSQMMKRIESYKDVQLSAEVFNSAIFACKRKGKENDESNDWQTALNLLQVMRRKRIQPTVKTYHATLQVLAGTGQVQMAKSIMQQLHSTPDMKPDDRVWAAAMNVCADALDYNGAIDFLNQMQTGGHRPNLLHASILLKAFALSGKDVMSLQALEMMTRKEQTSKVDDLSLSFHLPPMFPDLIALNTIISACAHAGNIPAALSVVARMREGEFQDPVNGKIIFPDRISYHNILRSCQDPDIAMDIIKEVSPSLFRTVIFVSPGALNFARKMRLSRRKRYGVVTPSSVTYAHAINTCQQAEEADVMRATTLLSWALDDGIKPTVYMFVPAIWAAQRSGDRTAALDFFLQMVDFGCTPNAVAYNGVISALCDNCDVEHAILIYEEMKDRGMNLNASVFKVRHRS